MFLSNCQGLSGFSENCNGSSSQPIDHRASLVREVKIPLDKGAKKNDECLVAKRRNGRNNCDAVDRAASEIGEVSLEAHYFENEDSTWSKDVERGFGNAKRHVLLSLFSYLVLSIFRRLAFKYIGPEMDV